MSGFCAVPPDLHDGAGVVFCNPERTRLVAQLRAAFEPDEWDDGSSGESAAESARRFARRGIRALTVFAGPRDLRGAGILEAACRAEGLAVEIERTAANGTTVRFPQRVAKKGRWKWIDIPFDAGERKTFLQTFEEWCSHLGEDRMRLTPPPLAAFPRKPGRRSPLPAGLGLEDPEWRKGLLWLVAEHFPCGYPALLVSIGAHDFGANPAEDFYAGLGLRERNAELLVNIVEP